MKVSELTGAMLDYWVARAEGFTESFAQHRPHWVPYSWKWEYGGPIIEREKISVNHQKTAHGQDAGWTAKATAYWLPGDGPTPLIAAMRAFVASKFGEEVADNP